MSGITLSPGHGILETELELALKQRTLKKIVIAETPEGFYIIAQLKWTGKKEWYVTTRRERSRPKLFKDLKRLNDHLKAKYSTKSVEILRDQKVPYIDIDSSVKK